MRKAVKSPIQHVVIIVKENHAFDNYFGRFPGADGDPNLALASDPPSSDHPHTHAAWLNRANIAAIKLVKTLEAETDKLTQIREEDSEPQDERLVRWFECRTIPSIRSAIREVHHSCG